MKIAVTGGSGFIGTVLVRLLTEQGHEVAILDIRDSKIFPELRRDVDVRDRAALMQALKNVDAVYHLAAEHRDDVQPVQKYYDVNVGGAENLVAAAQANGIETIIFTSSVAVYGLDAGESRETDTPAPFNDYGRSKLQSEDVFNAWAAQSPRRKLVNARLVATFGPGNRGNLHTLMDQIAQGKFVMVGSGNNRKSIAYVGNVAEFLSHVMTVPEGIYTYNYADKPDLTMRELVAQIRQSLGMQGVGLQMPYVVGLAGGMTFDVAAKITGRNFPISAIRVKKFCANTVVNADKLRATGFHAPYSLAHGLREMMAAEFPQAQKAA